MVISIHVSSSEVSADSNFGLWPAKKVMQCSPDRDDEEGISHSRRLVVASGHLLLCAKGSLVSERL